MLTLLAAATVAGCKDKPAADAPADADTLPSNVGPAAPMAITDRDWTLVELGDNTAPMGNGDRPVTLRLVSANGTAGGFAGCNRYNGPYTLEGNRLTFGPAISTKMGCQQGMDVEVSYLGMLPQVTNYEVTSSALVLVGGSGPLARFASGPGADGSPGQGSSSQ